MLIVPKNSISPYPSATNPKLPNDELEFVKSHWPPDVAAIPMSQAIVNIETNWAYALLDNDTPIPASLYWVNESHTIDLRSCPKLLSPEKSAFAWSPLIFIPILFLIKLVQFLTYGDLHLPEAPSSAGPKFVKPVTAWKAKPAATSAAVGGNATAPQLEWSSFAKSCPVKLRFSIKHPLLTWKKSLFLFFGISNTNLKSSPLIATSSLRPIGLSSM